MRKTIPTEGRRVNSTPARPSEAPRSVSVKNVRSCQNCGLPEYATCASGETLRLRILSKARFKRDCTKTVWVCDQVCSLQARAIAAMGPATHKWPMTLAEFAATEKRHHK